MTTITENKLHENSKISIFHQNAIDGYLYGTSIFFPVFEADENPTIAYTNSESLSFEESSLLNREALFALNEHLQLVETTLDSSGNREEFLNELEKSIEMTFYPASYEVIEQGDVIPSKETAVVEEQEVAEVEQEVQVNVEVEVSAEDVKENVFTTTTGVVPTMKLTKAEKRDTSLNVLVSLFEDETKAYALKDICESFSKQVDFDLSSTSIRNFLLDLVANGRIFSVGRGLFSLSSEVKSTEFVSANESNVVELPKTSPNSVSNEPTTNKEVKHTLTVVEEEFAKATSYSNLFTDDNEVREYLKMFDVSYEMMEQVLSIRSQNRERLMDAPQFVVDSIPSSLEYLGYPNVLVKSLAAFISNNGLNLKGPAGTGKSTLVKTLNAVFNLPLFTLNGSLEASKSSLVGEPTIKQAGVITVKDGQMHKAAIYGGTLFIDEVNMLRPENLSLVNPFNDRDKSFYNDVRGVNVKAHSATRYVTAMNEGYAGVKTLNKATNDRTVAIRLNYLNVSELKTLLARSLRSKDYGATLPDITFDKYVTLVAKYYTALVAASQSGSIDELSGSTRSVLQLVELLPLVSFQLALEMVLDKFTKEDAMQIVGVLSAQGLLEEFNVDLADYIK